VWKREQRDESASDVIKVHAPVVLGLIGCGKKVADRLMAV
jgi:hypothetical protein